MNTSRPTLERAAHVEARRIDERDAREHELGGALPAIRGLELGELQLVVDAQHFGLAVGAMHGGTLSPSFDRHRDDVGEVVLALRIVVLAACASHSRSRPAGTP